MRLKPKAESEVATRQLDVAEGSETRMCNLLLLLMYSVGLRRATLNQFMDLPWAEKRQRSAS